MMILKNGDYVPNGKGGFLTAEDKQELIHRVLFQLTARRGAFPLLPEVGSRLHQLLREKPSDRQTFAVKYVAEALSGEKELEIQNVQWENSKLTLSLVWKGETINTAVAL